MAIRSSEEATEFNLSVIGAGCFFFAILAGGFSLAFQKFSGYLIEFSLLNVISLAAFVFLIKPLSHEFRLSLVVYVMLFVYLISYFLHFFVIVLLYDEMAKYTAMLSYNGEVLVDAYGAIAVSFCLFSLATRFAYSTLPRQAQMFPAPATHYDDQRYRLYSSVVVGAALSLMVSAYYIVRTYHVAMMGAIPVKLPYKLSGLTLNAIETGIPLLLILALSWGLNRRDRFLISLVWSVVIAHGLCDLLIRTSKNMLFMLPGTCFFLHLLVRRRLTTRTVTSLLIIAFLLIVSYPIFIQVRSAHFRNEHASVLETSMAAISDVDQSAGGVSARAAAGAMALLNRFTGANSLLDMAAKDAGGQLGLGIFKYRLDPGEFFTREIYGTGGYSTQAPGFIGWMYIVGGTALVGILTAIYIFILMKIWLAICSSKSIVAKPFVLTSVILFILPFITDGLVYPINDSGFLKVAGFLVLVWMGEKLTRALVAGTFEASHV